MPEYAVAFIPQKTRGPGSRRKRIIVEVHEQDGTAAVREARRQRPDLAELEVDVSRTYGAYVGINGNRLTKLHR